MKIFVEGGKPSVNFIAMHSRDGQDDRNFFGEAFTNILPPAVKAGSFFLTASFAGAIATMPVLSAMDKCGLSCSPLTTAGTGPTTCACSVLH